jgi:hypothetical protein
MASELVEKVRDALTDHWNSADIVNGETQARIAIKAVAEWQMGRDAEQWQAGSILLAQLEDKP